MSYSFDLRAPSIPVKRFHTRAEKYYNFRIIKPGQLNRPHYCIVPSSDIFWYDAPISEDTPIEVCNKQRMYIEAQQWPSPPKYHHAHVDKFNKRGRTLAYGRRKEKVTERTQMLQRAVGPEMEWTDDEEGMRHFQNARGCGLCEAEMEWEAEQEDGYETEAEDEDWEVREKIMERGEAAVGWLIEDAEMKKKRRSLVQLEKDEWSICGSEDSSSSDKISEFELV